MLSSKKVKRITLLVSTSVKER